MDGSGVSRVSSNWSRVGVSEGRSLLWRVVTINSLVWLLATLVLALSPATVSARPDSQEMVVLAVGLVMTLAANVIFLRRVLAPLDNLATVLDQATSEDLLDRVPEPPAGLPHRMARAVNDLLERIEAAQRRQSAAALAAQEGERARIAQELHDGLGQNLTALVLEADMLARKVPEDLGGRAVHLRETARDSLDEVRRVARQLRPGVLEDLGLRSALASLGSDLFAHTDVLVERSIASGLPELDDSQELVVFRVAQEALTNVARHARAQHVHITLQPVADRLVLSVQDDGRGIVPGQALEEVASTAGSGIAGMSERAGLVGGELDITSSAGHGTIVTLSIPVEVA